MDYRKITIIGAGHGGYAALADLTLEGFQVTLYDLPEYQSNLFPLMQSGRIKLTGEKQGIVPITDIAVDIEHALYKADAVLIMTHAAAHARIAEMMAPYIQDEQLIVLLPGYMGGALLFHQIFKRLGVLKNYILAETNTLPYACRKISGEAAVHMKLYVKRIWASAFPSKRNDSFLTIFRNLYPNTSLAHDVLETGFNNGNPILNVIPSIFNAGRIEYAKGEYYHYQEGVTPTIAHVMSMADEERMQIGRSLGIHAMPYLQRVIETGYVKTNSSWYEAISTSPHLSAKGPESLADRYITEDIPFGLTPLFHLAQQQNVKAPLIQSFICLGSALTGQDYFKFGRTLSDMGIEGMTGQDLRSYLYDGN